AMALLSMSVFTGCGTDEVCECTQRAVELINKSVSTTVGGEVVVMDEMQTKAEIRKCVKLVKEKGRCAEAEELMKQISDRGLYTYGFVAGGLYDLEWEENYANFWDVGLLPRRYYSYSAFDTVPTDLYIGGDVDSDSGNVDQMLKYLQREQYRDTFPAWHDSALKAFRKR
ncbi:MAG: hypothetical protein AAF570_18395, partial [Bacteroidota bacterium]